MVLEDLFESAGLRHRPFRAFLYGSLFTFLSFVMALFFFRSSMSVAMVLLTTLLLVPTLTMMIRNEEKVEGKYGLRHFFRNHKDIIEVYIFGFLGVFLAFVVVGAGLYDQPDMYKQVFSFQTNFLTTEQGVSSESVRMFVDNAYRPTLGRVGGIFAHDLLILIFCFVLSFVYGATAIFLVILNGSVFANFIIFVVKTLAQNIVQGAQAFAFFLIHLLPEVSGFMIAAIAGGVVSKAVMHEKRGSAHFKNVFKDATVLLGIAILLVLIGAVIEVFVTAKLFQMFF